MITRDHIIRVLANWFEARITRKAPHEDVVDFLASLSPEERSGIWKMRTFRQRYDRGKRAPYKPRGSYGPRMGLDAWASKRP